MTDESTEDPSPAEVPAPAPPAPLAPAPDTKPVGDAVKASGDEALARAPAPEAPATRAPEATTEKAGKKDKEPKEKGADAKPPAAQAAPERLPWTYILLAANLLLVWGLPLIPAQDLPQHLTYIRIFADYNAANLPFHDFYVLPSGFQPYDSIYLLLAFIARHTSVLFALRVALSFYVVLVFAGFDLLSASIHGRGAGYERRPLESSVMASMIVWSSALSMGFLQYFLCVPFVMLTVASLVRASDRGAKDWVVLAAIPGAVAVASIHLVAAGALAGVCVFHALLGARSESFWRRAVMAGVIVGTILTTLVLWRFWGGEVLGARPRGMKFDEAWTNAQGFEFVNNMLDATWYDPPVTFNYITWGTLGPYRITGMAVSLLLVILALTQVVPVYQESHLRPEARAYGRTAWAFGIFTCLVPWGIQVPSEITWLNFRLISLAFALLLPLVPPGLFAIPRASRALTALACGFLINFTVHAIGFNHEAASPIRLLARVPNNETVLSLVFRSRSAYYAKGIRVAHFLPMYFTILDGGICTQFWARYTEHLPIDYRSGKRPAQPDDWSPQNFDETKHLKDSGYVLLQRTTEDDPRGTQNDAARAEQKLSLRADLVDCDGVWCLYKVRH